MLFLLSCTLLIILAVISTRDALSRPSNLTPARALGNMVWLGLPLAVAAPVIVSVLQTINDMEGQTALFRNGRWIVVASLIGSLGILGISGWTAFRVVARNPTIGRVSLIPFAQFFFSMICAVSTLSHLAFELDVGGGFSAGFADTAFLRDVDPEVQCNAPIVLLRWNEKDDTPVRYRCPTGDVAFLQYSNVPFVPWPNYREGQSILWAKKLSALHAGVRK